MLYTMPFLVAINILNGVRTGKWQLAFDDLIFVFSLMLCLN